jgi:signal transduction histidine kinase
VNGYCMIPQNRYNSIGILLQIQNEINPLNWGFCHPHFWLAIMNSLSLKELILQKREYIIREMNGRLGQTPWSPYQEFILRTREGQRRLETWVGLLVRSLEGDRETFFKDEERVGYYRAVQGFPLSFSHQIHLSFRQVIGDILKDEAHQKRVRLLHLWGEIQELNEILFTGYHIVAASFLKTREELINEKVTYLQEISEFTREMITLFNLPEIIHFILRKMTQFFGTERCLILLLRNQRIQGIYAFPPLQENQGIRRVMEKTLEESRSLFIDEGGEIQREIDESQLKRVVAIPIQAHGRCYGSLALYNQEKGFKFTEKELGLLYQFLYITAVAFENAFMLEEIESNRQELRLLTSKMIKIQEEERKRLASDIHDTLAQALTGIGYKIQFCKELAVKNPSLLAEQFNSLIKTVHQAMDQSKELIASLRPDLIDTMGLVPALKRHIENFSQETGIRVTTHLPKSIQISSEANICLFRIAQESLMNIYKHSGAKTAELALRKEDGNAVLTISDGGKGFDISQGPPWMKDKNKLGLLSMKERAETVGGTLNLQSKTNRGFRVEAKIPIRQGTP